MEIPVKWRSFDSSAIFRVVRHRTIRFALAAGLAVYFAYHLTGFKPARIRLLVPNVDTFIIFTVGRKVFASGAYPEELSAGNFNAAFPYPPPAVVLFNAIGILGMRFFTAIWIILMTGGLLVTFRASVAGDNDDAQSAWLTFGALALVFSDYPVSSDLRLGNSNLVYLGLIFAAYSLLCRRSWFAGALLGLSISLKLYSGLLLLWLLLNGPKAALYAAAIAIVALWLLLPVALFGVGRTISLYASWREQLRIISGLGVYSFLAAQHNGPPLVTLRRAIIVLSGAYPDAAITRWLLGVLWAIWFAAIVWYAARAWTGRQVAAPSRAALADWTVLLLAPLPFSPWLEPYHGVPVVPGTILCLVVALDKRASDPDRIIAAAALSALLAMHEVRIPVPIRGLQLLVQFLVLIIAFGLLRPRLNTDPMSSMEHLMSANKGIANMLKK
jgi:hypothetical protein